MRIAYLDCFSGISGDMFLGALVDAGVSLPLLERTALSLNLGATLAVSRVNRSGITATKVDVIVGGQKDLPREEYWARTRSALQDERQEPSRHAHHDHEPEHRHAHEHGTGHGHTPHDHAGRIEPSQSHQHGRGIGEIRRVINAAEISDRAKALALSAFNALAEAEAKIHNTDLERVHFHEVGAIDALVDVICGAVGADALGVDRWFCSPLNVGGGTVLCAHGRFPIPAPATVELLRSAPIYSSGEQVELVTPTGASLLRALEPEFAPFPPMRVSAVGYGAGSRDLRGLANVLRISVGDSEQDRAFAGEFSPSSGLETVAVLEAGVDDLNPQVAGFVMERALAEGALDVFFTPVQMKKNRPGFLITLLSPPARATALARMLLAESSTLGVRMREERRLVAERHWVAVATRWGQVRMKVASLEGSLTHYAPEYEDCRRIAAEHKVPLKTVMQEAVQAYRNSAAEANENGRDTRNG